jgi:5-hydroxyisourate hydrolase
MSKENARREFLTAALAVGATTIITPGCATTQTTASLGISRTGRLTLHAIDTFYGATAPGLRIDVGVREGNSDQYRVIKSIVTIAGGRTAAPVLIGDEFKTGRYEFLLHFDDYFAMRGAHLPNPSFLKKVPIRFAVADSNENYHVPVLFSPWGYSYYRGS